jgi:hypothetical protein
MPRVAVNNADVSRAGVTLPTETIGDATNNHVINNDGNVIIVAHNTNASSTARTLTIHLPGAVDGQSITPRAYSIAAGVTKVFGTYPPGQYGTVMQVDVDNAELKMYTLRIPR